jgi:hypothetical protein
MQDLSELMSAAVGEFADGENYQYDTTNHWLEVLRVSEAIDPAGKYTSNRIMLGPIKRRNDIF